MLRGLEARLALIQAKVAAAAGCDFDQVCDLLLGDALTEAYVLGCREPANSTVPPLFKSEPMLLSSWKDGQADRFVTELLALEG